MTKKINKLVLVSLLFMPLVANAQAAATDAWGVKAFDTPGSEIYVSKKELIPTIASIINIVLSLLGVLATLLILYGGFTWMMSQGSSEKIDAAKKIISAGVIGIVIIFVAYAVARFVLQSLQNTAI